MNHLFKIRKKSSIKGNWVDRSALYMMLIPGIIWVICFQYLPKFGIVLAFKDYRVNQGIWGSAWNGLENFKVLFDTPDAWNVTRNTLLYNIAFILLNMILSVSLAIIFNEVRNKFLAKTYQTIFLMPHFLSYVIIAYLVFGFLSAENGIVNNTLLPMFGIDPISWYSESKYWPYFLTFVKLWKSVGYNSIVYLAAIAGINKEYYEAAAVDGANKLTQIIHITLPGIKNMVAVMTIMAFGGVMNSDFGLHYNVPMNSGLIKDTTEVLGTYIYHNKGDVSFSTAAGLYVSVVGMIMLLGVNWIAKKIDSESALF